MKKLVMIAAAVAALSSMSILPASAGCLRFGETGYHWYQYCVGPHFMYPHHRHCNRHGYCWVH
jgi:hypothetical protein